MNHWGGFARLVYNLHGKKQILHSTAYTSPVSHANERNALDWSEHQIHENSQASFKIYMISLLCKLPTSKRYFINLLAMFGVCLSCVAAKTAHVSSLTFSPNSPKKATTLEWKCRKHRIGASICVLWNVRTHNWSENINALKHLLFIRVTNILLLHWHCCACA